MAGQSVLVKPAVNPVSRPGLKMLGGKKFRQFFVQSTSTFLIALGAIVILLPVIWMLSTSLKNNVNVASMPPKFIPQEAQHATVDGKDYFMYDVPIEGKMMLLAAIKLDPVKSVFVDPANPAKEYYAPASAANQHFITVLHWENYVKVWTFKQTPFVNYMKNTIIYALVAVLGEVLIASLVAFGFARLRAPGKNILFLFILATMMLPFAVTMIPSFVMWSKYIPDIIKSVTGLDVKSVFNDSWVPLMVPKFFGSAYLIFLVRQFYMSIPKDYDEAARIDGCGFFQIWWRIMIPMSTPVLVAVAILSFMYHWNDYMGPLIYLNSTIKLPLSVGLAQFNQAYGTTPWNLMMGGSLIAVGPLILIFFVLNRYFIQGVVVSGVKG